jgi:hypothetical protein
MNGWAAIYSAFFGKIIALSPDRQLATKNKLSVKKPRFLGSRRANCGSYCHVQSDVLCLIQIAIL